MKAGDSAPRKRTYTGAGAPVYGTSGMPPIRRMRGWRLYAETGARLLDLRLLDNAGFLGAKGRFAGTRAKNGVDLGLMKEAPSVHGPRLKKVLLADIPGAVALRFYRNKERALEALSRALGQTNNRGSLSPAGLYDPLARGPEVAGPEAPAAVERFFLEDRERALTSGFALRLLTLPCPEPFGITVLLFSDAAAAEAVREDELAPIQPFAALRAWADFRDLSIRLIKGRRVRSGEGAPAYTEKLWAKTDRRLSTYFERRGPYLYPLCSPSDWPEFQSRSLAGGCALTPDWGLPSIVPGEFDDGELKKLIEALGKL